LSADGHYWAPSLILATRTDPMIGPTTRKTPSIDLEIDVLHGVHAAEPPSDPA